jgi:hypothetical protein
MPLNPGYLQRNAEANAAAAETVADAAKIPVAVEESIGPELCPICEHPVPVTKHMGSPTDWWD